MENDLAKIEDGTFDFDSLVPLDIDGMLADSFRSIYGVFASYVEDGDVSSVKMFLEQLMNDAEIMFISDQRNGTIEDTAKAAIVAVQAAASVAGSSLELWDRYMKDPSSIFYQLITSTEEDFSARSTRRELEEVVGSDSSSNSTATYMLDGACARRLVVWTTLQDLKASIKKTISVTGLKLFLAQSTYRWAKLFYKITRGATTASLAVYGIDIPRNVDILFGTLERVFKIDIPFLPPKNNTKMCDVRVPVE